MFCKLSDMPPITPDEALELLKKINTEPKRSDDPELNHIEADEILCRVLLGFGCNKEILEEFDKVSKWYA